jgi:rhodanese-related sulfurtransferase
MLQDLRARAQSGLEVNDPTALDVTPQEAWSALHQDANAQMVDVRTAPEWAFVGMPSLATLGKKVEPISWRLFPGFEVNPAFLDQLKAALPDTNTPIFFICRTGGRSLDAALAARKAGYASSFNIAGGFEGELDSQQHRGIIGGWKAANLPWEQN